MKINDTIEVNGNFNIDIRPTNLTYEQKKAIINEEVPKNEKYLNFAAFSIVLLNDIACGEVTDLENKLLANKSVYAHDVKFKFKALKSKRKEYTWQINKAIKGMTERFCDMADIYNEQVYRHYKVLRMQIHQECLRLRVPYPDLTAEVILMRDSFYIALGNYQLWGEDIERDIPNLKGIHLFGKYSIESWETALNQFIEAYCKTLKMDKKYLYIENENIKKAREIVFKIVNNYDVLQQAINDEAEMNED